MTDPHLDIRDLKFFVAIAKELHFGRAAKALRVTQPHLSLQTKQLEERLGVRLLNRTTRSVELTPVGERFRERAVYLLAQFDETVSVVRRLGDGIRVQINIGFTPAASHHTLPWIITEIQRRHPEIHLGLRYMHTEAQIGALNEGRLDFGFLRPPVHSKKLTVQPLTKEGVVVALPCGHRLADKTDLRLADLADEDFVYFGKVLGFEFQEEIFSRCHAAGFTPKLTFEAVDTYSCIALVSVGCGVAILPAYIGATSHPMVTFHRLPDIPNFIYLAAAWQTDHVSPACDAVRGVLDAYLRSFPLNWS